MYLVYKHRIKTALLEEEKRLQKLHLKTLFNYYKSLFLKTPNFEKNLSNYIFNKHRNLLNDFVKNKNYIESLIEQELA